LRKTSLDELPELCNVLKGDLSLVGLRHLLMEYSGKYSTEHARRLNVKRGITGWAQINGRNAISGKNSNLMYGNLKVIFIKYIKVIKRENESRRACHNA